MENLKRRGLSLLLALVMIVSLFAGIQLPQASAATYVYNWGQRGELATELSDSAETWWSTKPAYTSLAAMDGSSNLNTISNSELYSTLASIMTNAHTTKTTYDGTRDLYQYTDCQNGGGKISSFYSGTAIGPDWDSGSTWNREHTWPNSKGLGGKDENDIMMLRPTATSENGSRSNKAYGEGADYFDPNIASYNVHGDVARIFLYSYVRWGIVDGNGEYDTWGSNGVMESVDVLLDWMEEDPVDTWELGRNDAVESITGTRNVFVDYPELAFLLFNESVPTGYTTPSGGNNTSTSSYAVTLKENGVTVDTLTGNSVELPTATAPEGYTFEGWVAETVDSTDTKPANVYTGSYAPTADITLHALYSQTETTGGGTGSESTTVSTTIADIAATNSWENSTQYTNFTMGDNITVTAIGGGNTGKYYTSGTNWRLYQSEDATVTISSNSTISSVKITYSSSSSGALKLNGTTVSSNDVVNVNANSVTLSVGNTGTGTTGQARITAIEVVLAGSSGGTTTTTYTTTTCAHADTENVAAQSATCTADGYTAGVYCNDCNTYISGHEVIKSEGHNYESVVTPPTATEQGYTTHTCTACGDSKVDTYVPALGEDFTVSFVVPNTVTAIAPVTGNNAGVTLPTAEAPEGYTFVGWVSAQVPDTETKPTTVYESGTTTAITQTTTLYALYSYTASDAEGNTSANYVKVTKNPIDWSGEYLIVYEDGSVIFDGSKTTFDAVGNTQSVTITDGKITSNAVDDYSFTIAAMDDGYSIQGTSGKYIGNTSDSNGLTTSTDALKNALSMNVDGSVNIISSGGAYLRYNSASNQTRFRYYQSSTYTNQKAISLYVKVSGETHYTTTVCAHTNTSTVTTVEPTCTEAGEKAVKCSDCGAIISTEDIEALGHNFANDVCTRCGIEQFTVTFVTPAGVTAVDAITFIDGESVSLPDTLTGAPTGGLTGVTYTFIGWSSEIIDNDPDFDTTTSTYYDLYEADPTFQENTTLYAVYTYTTQDGDGNTDSGTTTETNNYTVTISEYAAANGWVNAQKYTEISIAEGLTVTASTGNNNGYTNLTQWRIYQADTGTITFKCTNGTISSIKITYNPQNTGCLVYGTANISSGTSVTINAVEATFSAGNTGSAGNGQARITKIEVSVIPSGGGSTPTTTTYYTTVIGEEACAHTNTIVSIVDGYKVETCDSCGATVSRTKLELKFYGASLEVGEGISINYKVAASLFAENLYDLDSACATFVFNKESEDERTFTVSNPVLSGDYYVFQLKNIRPDWMGDVVTATLTATDANGESITSKAIEYSVAEYCYNKLNASDSTDALKTLLIDMLDYGAATQLHTGYKTDALVTDNAAYTNNASLGTSSAPTLNAAPAFGTSLDTPAAAWKGAALFLRETVRIRLRFTAESIDGVTVTAQIGDNDPVVLDSFTSAGNNVYYVFFDNLLATQMREDVVFTVMQNGTAISNTLTYSVEAYATSATATAGTLADMLNAMMNYGDAVYAYAG